MKKTPNKKKPTAQVEVPNMDFRTDSKGNFIAPMNVPNSKPKATKKEPNIPTVESVRKSLTDTLQAAVIAAFPALIVSILTGLAGILKGILFTGQAGTGKSTCARKVADVLGAELHCVPANISFGEFMSGQFEKDAEGKSVSVGNWHGIENICSDYKNPDTNKILFFDEWHKVSASIRTWLLTALDPGAETPTGGSTGNEWTYRRDKVLVIAATNKGERDQAMAGEDGRFEEIEILPLTKEGKAKVLTIRQNIECVRFGVTFKADGTEMLGFYTSNIGRNIENLTYRCAKHCAGQGVREIGRADVIEFARGFKVEGVSVSGLGPDGLSAYAMKILTYVAANPAQRERSIMAGIKVAQRNLTEFREQKAKLEGRGLLGCNALGRAMVTAAGVRFLEDADNVMNPKEPNAKTPNKKGRK
jgi:hypothetical protein